MAVRKTIPVLSRIIALALLLCAIVPTSASAQQYPDERPWDDAATLAPYLDASEKLLNRLYPDAQRHCPAGLKFFVADQLGTAEDGRPATGQGGYCSIWLNSGWRDIAYAGEPSQKRELCRMIAHERGHSELWLKHVAGTLMDPGEGLLGVPAAECDEAFPDPPPSALPAPSVSVAPSLAITKIEALKAVRKRVGKHWKIRAFVTLSESVPGSSEVVTEYGAVTTKRVCKARKAGRRCKKIRRSFAVSRSIRNNQISVRKSDW